MASSVSPPAASSRFPSPIPFSKDAPDAPHAGPEPDHHPASQGSRQGVQDALEALALARQMRAYAFSLLQGTPENPGPAAGATDSDHQSATDFDQKFANETGPPWYAADGFGLPTRPMGARVRHPHDSGPRSAGGGAPDPADPSDVSDLGRDHREHLSDGPGSYAPQPAVTDRSVDRTFSPSQAQIKFLEALRNQEDVSSFQDFCRRSGVSPASVYRWQRRRAFRAWVADAVADHLDLAATMFLPAAMNAAMEGHPRLQLPMLRYVLNPNGLSGYLSFTRQAAKPASRATNPYAPGPEAFSNSGEDFAPFAADDPIAGSEDDDDCDAPDAVAADDGPPTPQAPVTGALGATYRLLKHVRGNVSETQFQRARRAALFGRYLAELEKYAAHESAMNAAAMNAARKAATNAAATNAAAVNAAALNADEGKARAGKSVPARVEAANAPAPNAASNTAVPQEASTPDSVAAAAAAPSAPAPASPSQSVAPAFPQSAADNSANSGPRSADGDLRRGDAAQDLDELIAVSGAEP